MDEELLQIFGRIDEVFESGQVSALGGMIAGMRAPDVADIIEALDEERRAVLFGLLDDAVAAEVLTLLDEGSAAGLLRDMASDRTVQLVALMASDDAADIVSLLPDDKSLEVLRSISREDYEDLSELLKFHEESAGGIMAREILTARGGTTVGEVIRLIRAEAREVEHLQNIYIVDSEGILIGEVPLLNLLLVEPDVRIDDIMTRETVTVGVETDQEEVASIFSKFDIYTLPVLDARGRLVGRITVDDVLDVLEEEATEDITIMAGTGEEEFFERSSLRVSRARLPWLFTGLIGGIASAIVMKHFSGSFETILTLAFFVPVIMAMGGNVGIQSSAIVVRELALGTSGVFRTSEKIIREIKVSLINGFVLGGVLLLVVVLWQRDLRLGLLLCLSLTTIIVWGTLMGAIVPLLLKRINIDPALATGPFITTSNDILGLLIYLGIASAFLDWLGGG